MIVRISHSTFQNVALPLRYQVYFFVNFLTHSGATCERQQSVFSYQNEAKWLA